MKGTGTALRYEPEHSLTTGNDPLAEMITGYSAAMQKVAHMVRQVALYPTTTVLLQGESGTGKDVVARAIHRLSSRAARPFVAINCAAIPETLLETELFGVEEGAFTDAKVSREGYFSRADGGTLFLDEIGAMPLPLQAKLCASWKRAASAASAARAKKPASMYASSQPPTSTCNPLCCTGRSATIFSTA